MQEDVLLKLQAIRDRRRVTQFCASIGKTRSWFYKALRGEVSLLEHLDAVDAALKSDAHPVTAAREAIGLSRVECARLLGISRQTVYKWEREPARTERIEAISRLSK